MNRKKVKGSIKWRIFAAFAGFTAIMLALLWILQIFFLQDFYQAIKTNTAKRDARTIAANLTLNNSEFSTLINRIAQNSETCIYVFDLNDGKVLADSDVLLGCVLHKIIPIERYRLCLRAEEMGGEFSDYFQQGFFRNSLYSSNRFAGDVPLNDPGLYDSLLYIRIITNKSGHRIAVMLNVAITPVDSTVQTLRLQLLSVTVIMLILAAVIALILSRSVSHPISGLNDSAKALATGNYDVTFEARGYREIAELAESLTSAGKELSRVDEYRRELLANVSHDMRTPLTLIAGYTEMLRDIPDEVTEENFNIILEETKRLSNLVEDMIEQSQYEDAIIRIQPVRFSLSEDLNTLCARYVSFTRTKGMDIRSNIAPGLYVYADQSKITQAMTNLINNALTYTGTDGKIFISLSQNGNAARFSVTDTGIGIPEDKLAHIWNRYYKIDKEHRRSALGSGIGLSIVRNIMELHHAEYGVTSKEGEGSTFWFELPLCEKEPNEENGKEKGTEIGQ